MEAEARAILAEVCSSSDRPAPAASLQDWVDRLYGGRKPANVVRDLIAERRREGAAE
jgi:plasmid stability protein